MFGSPENSHIVAWILTRKLYEYLDEANISVEVSDGEVMLDAHLPPADVVAELDRAVDMRRLEDVLMAEGVEKFVSPQKALLTLIASRRSK